MEHGYTPSTKPQIAEYKVDYVKMHKHARSRVTKKLKEINISTGAIFLKGGISTYQYDTDRDQLFRQESNFQYLFGVAEPDCFAAIDIATEKSILFVPRLPAEYAVWLGEIQPTDYFRRLYQVDEVHFTDEALACLQALQPSTIYVIKSIKDMPDCIASFTKNDEALKEALDQCRLIKSEEELDLMRHVNKISSYAHTEVMKACHPGMKEFELEALFLHLTYVNGRCRYTAYTCICASGKHGATLHYPNNDKDVSEGHMILLDMGAEYHCYCSDITCSFPANGKFTQDQKEVYETVLAAQTAVMAAMKPGVPWEDMHRLAERVICEGLLKHGFIQGSIDDLLKHHVPALFFPHGLGHVLGLDTHDVGGYPKGVTKIQEPGIKNLRARRNLEKGMVITVEPGIYFIEALLGPALTDPVLSHYLNADKIKRFMNFGGVRLEDDVIVTENGIENMTHCPRTVEDIEQVMQHKNSSKFDVKYK